jgi:hypothetical protein
MTTSGSNEAITISAALHVSSGFCREDVSVLTLSRTAEILSAWLVSES